MFPLVINVTVMLFSFPFCRQMLRISRSLACFKDSYLVSGYVRKIKQKVEKFPPDPLRSEDFVPSYYENLQLQAL